MLIGVPVSQVLEAAFLFCCTWSLGAALVQVPGEEDQDRFSDFLKRLALL